LQKILKFLLLRFGERRRRRVRLETLNPMMQPPMHVYDVRPRKDHRGVDLISDALPFGRLWYGEPNAISNAIRYAQHYSRSMMQ